MTKLSKADVKRQAELVEALNAAKTALENAITGFNEAVAIAFEAVTEAKDKYNEAIQAAEGWRSDIAAEQDSYFDEKSEKWQEGEKGDEYSTWKDAWAEELSEIEISAPDEMVLDDADHADTLEGFPSEPGM